MGAMLKTGVSEMEGIRRIAVIVTGVIFLVLVVGEIYAIADYTTINSLRNQASSLNSQITDLQTQIASLNAQIFSLNTIVNLENSTVLVNAHTISQQANYCSYNNFTAGYAGYVSVNVQSSTNNTYVQVVYSSYGVDYNHLIFVGTSGTAVFPVLPANIQVRIGNTNPSDDATETITIKYYF